MPKIWQDFGYASHEKVPEVSIRHTNSSINRHVPRHEWSRPLSPIQSRSREHSSSQRISSVSELPSIPADASASYLELITPKARPFSRLERLSGTVVPSMAGPKHNPKVDPNLENAPCPEPQSRSEEGHTSPGREDKPELNQETEHLNTLTVNKASSNEAAQTRSNENPVQPSSTTKSNNPQPSKAGSVTAEDLIGLELPYHLLFAADNTPPQTRNPTATKLPILLSSPSPPPSPPHPLSPPAQTPPREVDDAFLSQPVPTKYLPINEQRPNRMSWRDVLDLAQNVLSDPVEEQKPIIRSKVNLLTVSSVDENLDADRHSLLAKSHVAEVEEYVDDEEEGMGSSVRSSFSSFDIRDVNLSLHEDVSRIWSWREKWRGKQRVSGSEGG